jgi:hypothetical protein
MQGYQWPYYPRIGVGVSGYGWVDSQYKYTRVGDPGQSAHNTKLFAQGRFNLRLTPTYTNGSWFVQAQAEIIGNLNQLDVQPNVVDTDDLWVRTGVWKKWDITVGRFEAFPVYHLGMGLDLNTDERAGAYDGVHGAGHVPQPYLASYMYYRPRGPENAAVHLYFLDQRLRIEGLVQWGSDNIVNVLGDVATVNVLGARGAAIFDLGWIKFRYAHEYQWQFPPDPATAAHNEYRNRGGAGSIQLVFAPWIEFGPNFGKAITDAFLPSTVQADGSFLPHPGLSGDVLSYGGFLNVRPFDGMLIGTGANYTSFTNLHTNTSANANDKSTNTQYFVALQYLVNRQLFVKLVGGYAKTRFDFSFNNMLPYEDDMFSVRLRLMYLY